MLRRSLFGFLGLFRKNEFSKQDFYNWRNYKNLNYDTLNTSDKEPVYILYYVDIKGYRFKLDKPIKVNCGDIVEYSLKPYRCSWEEIECYRLEIIINDVVVYYDRYTKKYIIKNFKRIL